MTIRPYIPIFLMPILKLTLEYDGRDCPFAHSGARFSQGELLISP